jgi:hypothetical protein
MDALDRFLANPARPSNAAGQRSAKGRALVGAWPELLLVVATPAYGSHYVVDVIAGILIAAACWLAVARLLDAASETHPERVAAIDDPPSIVPEARAQPAMAAHSRDFESA